MAEPGGTRPLPGTRAMARSVDGGPETRRRETDGLLTLHPPSIGAADFGNCTPTMDFQLGRGNRKATEGTFLPTDPTVAQGQSDALNPNIITNAICNQLTNVCNANAAAKALCEQAKATVQSLGTKDATTATAFNSALGF